MNMKKLKKKNITDMQVVNLGTSAKIIIITCRIWRLMTGIDPFLLYLISKYNKSWKKFDLNFM